MDALVSTVPAHEPWRRNLGRAAEGAFRGPRPASWWTGARPEPGLCPGVGADGVITSLPQPHLASASREDLLAYFDNTWTLTEVLFSGLAEEEAFYRPAYHNLRHPLIFYYAHPAVLYVNKLRVAGLLAGPVNEAYEHLFETGVDEMSWDDLSKNELDWPSVAETTDYRRRVYRLVRELIETHPDLASGHAPITQKHPLWAVVMGFEHERIHLETSSVLMRELPVQLLQRPAQWPADHPSVPRADVTAPEAGRDYPLNALVNISEGVAKLGKPLDWPSFGWDNTYGADTRHVPAFAVSQFLVSNGEFLEFVKAGGYREQRYWSEAGWGWRHFRNAKWPTFWVKSGPAGLHEFKLRALFEVVPMPWSWPAEVNWYEAEAYLAWRREHDGKPYRFASEAEHQRMRDASLLDERAGVARDPVMQRDGRAMAAAGINLNLAWGSPSPVDAGPASSAGVHDALGNVWQWQADHFHPLPGFRVHPLYEDFSTPCFDGRHQMILGGSFMATGEEASIWARFHFRPHFFQHAGFRLACSAEGDGGAVKLDGADQAANAYETKQMLDEYLGLHYGAPEDQMPYGFGPVGAVGFPARCGRLVLEAAAAAGLEGGRALDVGCAVGGAVFEMARGFESVLGVDLSRSFVEAGEQLKRDGRMGYDLREEGRLGSPREAVIDPAIDRRRVAFRQADACSLPAELEGFEAVLLANLLCRLPSPRALLGRLGRLVRPGGVLVLVSPYTWLEQFTPLESWLGGFERDGQPVRGRDTLIQALSGEFELVSEQDMPLVIREHARKYQYIVSHAMVWKRR